MQRKPTREGMVNERISINIHLRTSTDQTSTVKSGSKYDSPFQYFCISFFYISVLLYVCISVFQTERETNTFLRPIPVRPSAVRSGSNDIPGRLSRFLFQISFSFSPTKDFMFALNRDSEREISNTGITKS